MADLFVCCCYCALLLPAASASRRLNPASPLDQQARITRAARSIDTPTITDFLWPCLVCSHERQASAALLLPRCCCHAAAAAAAARCRFAPYLCILLCPPPIKPWRQQHHDHLCSPCRTTGRYATPAALYLFLHTRYTRTYHVSYSRPTSQYL